jgi:RNA polymerase sigma factor (sigma-70 family)
MMQRSSSQPDLKDTSVGRLYQRHWLGLFTAIRHSVSSQEDAEDILLDVFLAALESRTLLSMSEQYQEVWLRRVAYNKCMDFHRRAVRHPVLPLESTTETLSDENALTPERAVLHQEELAQLQKHLASLSTIQQEILRLRFADELPCARIAVRLDKSEGAVRTMLSRTLNLLRSMYTKQREESYHE